jgi:hypothetical protein
LQRVLICVNSPCWIHEIKHDGYRLMARREPVGIRLITAGATTGHFSRWWWMQ